VQNVIYDLVFLIIIILFLSAFFPRLFQSFFPKLLITSFSFFLFLLSLSLSPPPHEDSSCLLTGSWPRALGDKFVCALLVSIAVTATRTLMPTSPVSHSFRSYIGGLLNRFVRQSCCQRSQGISHFATCNTSPGCLHSDTRHRT
jgi:hypothetical protein